MECDGCEVGVMTPVNIATQGSCAKWVEFLQMQVILSTTDVPQGLLFHRESEP
jgi:hypothetical protein